MLKTLKSHVARRIRRLARVDEVNERLSNIERMLHVVDHRAIDRDSVAEFVFLSELRTKSYTDDAISKVNGTKPTQANTFLSPEMYAALEDRFRGPTEVIRERLSVYLPYVASAAGGRHVVDFGCGRGEWLGVAKEAGFGVRGVEIDSLAVDICRANGFDVTHIDALSYLRAVEPGSLGAVTFFQVIEHLTLDELFQVLSAARTALAPGGLFLAEFPNISALNVGASTFWIDPTHLRPLHPELVLFMANQAGFELAEIHHSDLMKLQPDETANGQDWQRRVDGCPDVSVMAWA